MKTKKETIDVRQQIADHLMSKGIKTKWLADKIEVSPSHLFYVLNQERDLTDENLTKINAALETSFIQTN